MSAANRGGGLVDVFCGDFFSWYEANTADGYFDAVVGNPPFIRYQDFPEQHRQIAFELMAQVGLSPNRLTNAWLPFVVVAARALREGGYFGMVLPAELLQVNYAAELRQFLVSEFRELKIVTFREIVFPRIQQEVVIVLGVKGRNENARVSLIDLDNSTNLTIDRLQEAGHRVSDLRHGSEKWLQYYLTRYELDLIREIEKSGVFRPLGDYADVDVGIVTGRNSFFVLTEDEVDELSVHSDVIPLIGRSSQIPGLAIDVADWDEMVELGQKCFLLQLGGRERSKLPPDALRYIEWGEEQGFNRGYKCRIRMPNWWNVPSVWIPDAFLMRQIHRGPRIVSNGAGVVCTDTIHRIRTRDSVSPRDLAAVSINSMTSAFAEIRGRSYGGGVLELEPREAEALPVPDPTPVLDLDELDHHVRSGASSAVREIVDRTTLRSTGLSETDIRTLRAVWQKMSERRIHRKRRKS